MHRGSPRTPVTHPVGPPRRAAMTNDDPYVDFADTWPVSVPGDPQARAYGGAAHGHEWPVDDDDPPAWIELPVGVSSCLYRLVRQPRTGRPAHDYRGNYLYVPIA